MNTKTESTILIAPALSYMDDNTTQIEHIQQPLQSPTTRKALQVIKDNTNNTIVPKVLVLDSTFTPNSQLKKQIVMTQSCSKPVKSMFSSNLFSNTHHKEINHEDKENQAPPHTNISNPDKVIMNNGSVKRKVISPLASEKNELSRRDVSPTVQKTLEFSSPREKKLASRIIIRKHKTIEPPTANKTLLRFIF